MKKLKAEGNLFWRGFAEIVPHQMHWPMRLHRRPVTFLFVYQLPAAWLCQLTCASLHRVSMISKLSNEFSVWVTGPNPGMGTAGAESNPAVLLLFVMFYAWSEASNLGGLHVGT